MILKLIKLAGFKSFVEPTVIPIHSQLSSIIGPNGCGKSNVVDAIRWVIGESSAKQLRGQSMSDVIFNGSQLRKPVSKAAVELVFDNSAGRLGLEFAKFSEISIRREVSHDGHSQYYLNGTSCRRRDIIDIFLGTGLGPNSYAIIEQGMISQLIEAKPEEFRIYLEEAAGISKYKDRRRETETRISHTKENLDRLNDLMEELNKQLRHLKRQANAAVQYKNLKQQERLLQAQIKALQFRNLSYVRKEQEQKIEDYKSVVEVHILRFHEAEEKNIELQDQQSKIQYERDHLQQSYYDFSTETAKLDQQITHWQQQRSQWQDELTENSRLHQELQDNLLDYQEQQKKLMFEISQLQPNILSAKLKHQTDLEHLAQAEKNAQQQQERWESLQRELAEVNKEIGVAKTKQHHYSQQLDQLQIRQQELKQRQLQFDLEDIKEEIAESQLKVHECESQLLKIQQQLTYSEDQLKQQRLSNGQHKQDLNSGQQSLQKHQQRLASLEAIQQTALGRQDNHVNSWLKQYDLQQNPRLGQQLKVEPGWEMAVETVMLGYFDAICLNEAIETIYDPVSNFEKGKVTLISNHHPMAPSQQSSNNKTLLSSLVQTDYPIQQWLKNIYIAKDLVTAKKLLSELNADESVITPEGIWLGKDWIRIAKANEQQSGVLVRESELRQLRKEESQLIKQCEQQQQILQQGEEQLQLLEREKDQLHQQNQEINRKFSEVKSSHSAAQSRLNTLQQQHQQWERELNNNNEQIILLDQQSKDLQQQLECYRESYENIIVLQQEQQVEKEQGQAKVAEARRTLQEVRQQVDALTNNLSSAEKQLILIQQRLERDQSQYDKVKERGDALKQNLMQNEPLIQRSHQHLEDLLKQRAIAEAKWRQAEQQFNVYNQELITSHQHWQQLSRQIDDLKQQLQKMEIEHQETIVRQATIQEHLNDFNMPLENLLDELPEEMGAKDLEQQVEQVTSKINRLGPINLAAIEEHQTIEERKNYLDKQHADLNDALDTLTQAMNKIDRETKTKFKETYNLVNHSFQEIFPRIFGGGKAELILTDEDMLISGVVVKAHPPGKRNASVYSLSGGEKALTAISLVFALFQLNPAPFCILDEVDAPLDDVNVTRFCQLVKEMSKQTQFIVISHNKVTMSFAEHLMGVTMQEAGVSRIVSVDMQQAAALVDME